MSNLDDTTRKLLTEAQQGIKLSKRPFNDLAEEVGLKETEVIDRLNELKGDIIRRFGGIFRSGRLGFESILLAAAVSRDRIKAVAEEINKLSGVTHNYRRSHDYNLWFTLTVGPESNLETEIKKLEQDLEIEILRLPAVKRYKLGVKLDLRDEQAGDLLDRSSGKASADWGSDRGEVSIKQDIYRPDRLDKNIIALLQEDIVLVKKPFKLIADKCACTEDIVLDRLQKMEATGTLKRIAPLLYHRRSGYQANGMVVWEIDEAEIDKAGYQLATFKQVSHCYNRPALPPDWPYNLYAMTHAKSQSELEITVNEMAEKIKNKDYRIIYSLEEFKKSSMKYYSFKGRD